MAWLLAAFTAIAAPPVTVQRVTVEGSAFQIVLSDGHIMAQDELPGTILSLGDGSGVQRRIRIDSAARDAADIVLYELSEQQPSTGEWRNICEADTLGRRLAFPIRGRFTADARHVGNPNGLSIACSGGAEAKCVRFGYPPWRTGPDGVSLHAHYQACLRMVRADYCGDGVPHTKNGTSIGIVDRIGVHPGPPPPGMSFEAAWGPDGAVCVKRTRVREVFSLDDLRRSCPARVLPACDGSVPALLYVSSFED